MTTLRQVRDAKDKHKEFILSRPNVVGVGAGYKTTAGELTDQVCVVALVSKKVPLKDLPPETRIPSMVEEISTDVLEVGVLRALQSRTDRWRPAPPGVSLGHYRITAGTFGCVVRDRMTSERLILSNNHVLANENDASEGDLILQPGTADSGQVGLDAIATLLRFVPLTYEGTSAPPTSCLPVSWLAQLAQRLGWSGLAQKLQQKVVAAVNLVDAAVARPLEEGLLMDEILGIGLVRGTTTATLGMTVRKSGRTTELTSGQVNLVDSTVVVNYSGGRTARFENQILTSPMSQGGDSGSLLVAGGTELAVGLLFAGSDQITIHNPIQVALDQLAVHL
jgi:hypothetical protein